MRTVLALLLLSSAIPALAQEKPAAGSGVAALATENSAPRPIRFVASPPADAILVVPLARADDVAKAAAGLSADAVAAIQAGVTAARFQPAAGSMLSLYATGGYREVVILGLGSATPTPGDLADVGGLAIQALKATPDTIAFLTTGLPAGAGADLAYGAALGQYRYDRLQTSQRKPTPNQPILIVDGDANTAQRFERDLYHLAQAVTLARDLQNMPANELYPETFVEQVRTAFRGVANVRITILDEPQMRGLGMGALLGVGQGSRRPSRLIAVEYRGAGSGAPLALVGKGITFDTGGISIKPATGMWEMKGDMSGAAAVMGAVLAAAKRGARANVVAVAPLAENMAGGNAQRPGDVVRTLSGNTIEIINTDAEGRLVLVDANQWAVRQYQPAALVNIATLTGAIVRALGDEYAGLFARDDDLANRLLAAGTRSTETLWRMPLHPSYAADMRSDIADIKNTQEGGLAGAGTAAHFISALTPAQTPWAHIDMAAMDQTDRDLPTVPKGARGYGVRLLDVLIRGYEQ